MTENLLIITPKSKVFDLLEAYPQLEGIITGLVPALEKLKNPQLRMTVGKVSSLQQIAVMANISVDNLINMLRKEVGQSFVEEIQQPQFQKSVPDWFDKQKISTTLDVRPMLEAGEHPVHQVISELNQLPDGEIYKLVASFLPVPLIEKAISLDYTHYYEVVSENEFNIYFIKSV